MLNDYEIQTNSNKHIFIAMLKLCFSILVLYGAVMIIPTVVYDVQATQVQQAEQLKIRVVANSSSVQDQQQKQLVVENIQALLEAGSVNSQDIHNYEEIYAVIQKEFPNLKIVMNTGDNLIPPKYQFHTFYPQNVYNSVTFVIGSGRGENWFCSAFPTVCSPPEEVENEKHKFFIYEWFKKNSF
ncbi:stage II sporulation protein R [Solibacillus sp. FSL K6-1523]|uniref:stage II sporulation protein R n=1 Tax=Solibacillus sp. FSL K6-1523 TaxID=2921471 RepID=UPI0030FA0773